MFICCWQIQSISFIKILAFTHINRVTRVKKTTAVQKKGIHWIKLWSYPIFFSVMLFVFFTLICKRLSHILVTNYLSFISFTNIFSEPVTWLLTCILIHKYFLFSYRQIYQTSHFGYASGTLFKKPSLHSGSWKYFLPILPIFWNFLSLI